MIERENILLGAFEQGHGKIPISWLVLKRDAGRALILSRYALDSRAYSDAGRFCTWEESGIRQWLNNEFMETSFSAQERDAIVSVINKNDTEVEDAENQVDPDTEDSIFLLSMNEVEKLLPTRKERIAQATLYAEYQGAKISSSKRFCSWWLRSALMAWAIRIVDNGEMQPWCVRNSDNCVRPAMWVDLGEISKLTDDDRLKSKTDLTQNDDQTDEVDLDRVIHIETENGVVETTVDEFSNAAAEVLSEALSKAIASVSGVSEEDNEEDQDTTDVFPIAHPAPSLHWRYRTQMNVHNPFAALGATISISEEGAKFCGQIPNNDEYSAFMQKAYTLSLTTPRNYLSAKVFPVISNLFLVDSESFDNSRDRYCEIHERMIQKIPTISALRSFAWTLAAYTEQQGHQIKNTPIETLVELTDFIEKRKFLNYSDKRFFTELCGHSDLFSCYVPDQVDADELARLQKSFKEAKEAYDLVESYDDLNDVDYGSLDGLRRELDELIPVMERVYDYLLETRDPSTQLTGTLADVLYAWCTFANCAKTAFLTESGPRRCGFQNPRSDVYAMIQEQDGGYLPQDPKPLLKSSNKQNFRVAVAKPNEKLSQAAPETLGEMDDLIDGYKNVQDSLKKASDELTKQMEENERKKQDEIDKEVKKRSALSKTEKDTLDKTNLYIILQNESVLNKRDREDDEFYDTYDVDFPTLSKDELLEMRRGMLKEIKKNGILVHYEDTFRSLPFDDRYKTSTLNIYTVGMAETTDFDALARFAIEHTKHWYTQSELEQATRLIEQEVTSFRKDFREQSQEVNPAWTSISSANKLLYLEIREADFYDDATHPYQRKIPNASVAVRLRSKIEDTSISLYRFHGWFWGVPHKEIWDAAINNEIIDERDNASDGKSIAQQAYHQAINSFSTSRKTSENPAFLDPQTNNRNTGEKNSATESPQFDTQSDVASSNRRRRTDRYRNQGQNTNTYQPCVSLTKGQRNYKFGPYNWRVLDVQGGKALLLSEDIIELREYNSEWHLNDVNWDNCTLREYLNGGFFGRFNQTEQSRIAQVNNTNPSNPWFATKTSSNTTDRVFLLNIEEVTKCFGDSGQLKNKSPQAKEYIDDHYNDARKANFGSKTGCWWLRSNDLDSSGGYGCAEYIDCNGRLFMRGSDGHEKLGVRPALWLNL